MSITNFALVSFSLLPGWTTLIITQISHIILSCSFIIRPLKIIVGSILDSTCIRRCRLLFLLLILPSLTHTTPWFHWPRTWDNLCLIWPSVGPCFVTWVPTCGSCHWGWLRKWSNSCQQFTCCCPWTHTCWTRLPRTHCSACPETANYALLSRTRTYCWA